MNKRHILLIKTVLFFIIFFTGCTQNQPTHIQNRVDRESKIPVDAIKITVEEDKYPPQLHSEEWETPVPVPYPVSTAGAEDSAFILPEGNTLYFFFTPDVRVPPQTQVLDGVTGIYRSTCNTGEWSRPTRVLLQESGKLALDGAEFILDDTMWFASAREGYEGLHWFTARFENGNWSNWKNADFNPDYDVGELHISSAGDELYYHSERADGKGGLDLWVSHKENNIWQEPENIEAVNTPDNEGYPCISQDGTELWFTRTYMGSPAIYQSRKINESWQEPVLIISQFIGEPSLDIKGNIYFTHHFYDNNTMIEADIYVAYKK